MTLERAAELIANLPESRNVEVKRWIDPTSMHGKSKLVKGLFALRNFNGGYFVVGFDDTSLLPVEEDRPADVLRDFHPDTIQEIVSHFASEPFDIDVYFPELDGQSYPVIWVPSGVRNPVAAKRDLQDGDRTLIGCNDIYFRTLNSNNRVSSAKLPYKDLPELMRVCFDNHEADIGRFLRRHLGGLNTEFITQILQNVGRIAEADPDADELVIGLLDNGQNRYEQLIGDRLQVVPQHGSFEVALLIDGEGANLNANSQFLQLLSANNPNLTGWPIWLNSQGFREHRDHPFVYEGGWEALIVNVEDGLGGQHIDFMRKDPSGKFYLRRALQDDVTRSERTPDPNSELDFGLSIIRTAEAIAVGLAFANAMDFDRDQTVLEFGFRWRGLAGRELTSWAQPMRDLGPYGPAVQNEVSCRVSVPLDSPQDTISNYTKVVMDCLFSVFEGFEISSEVNNDLVARLLERRL